MFKVMRHALTGVLLIAAAGFAHAEKLSATALETAHAQGKARVIVMLQDPSKASLKSGDDALRKRDIAAGVQALLSRMPAQGHAVRRRFALVPAIAMDADAETLERLRQDPAVLGIDLDEPGTGGAVAPDEASVLNDVSSLQSLGFDGAGMKVAVIDSGIDTDHPDLAARLLGQQCFCSNASGSGGCCPNLQSSQSGAGAAEDGFGHGSNVTGIIVGAGNVAPRGAVPAAQLVAIKVLDNTNSFCCTSDLVAAMDWLAATHPDVDAVNLSLGTNALYSGHCDNQTAGNQALAAAVNALRARGAVVTVSTGNQGNSSMMSAPSCIQNAVSVGATWDFTGGARTFLGCAETSTAPRKPTCFTNRSATTDLYAAGAFVTSAGLNGGISTFGGTSMAAPMVAACAVALKQAVPLSTVDQRIDAMRLSPISINDAVSGRSYPFLACTDALRLLSPDTRSADFDGDGRSDILWRNNGTGEHVLWKAANHLTPQGVSGPSDVAWQVAGSGDFDADGKSDILWRNAVTGQNTIWRSATAAMPQTVTGLPDLDQKVAGVGDFDGDGKSDIFWRNTRTGANVIWRSANSATPQSMAAVSVTWQAVGVGDFDDDGKSDVLWRHSVTGANALWRSANAVTVQSLTTISPLAWKVVGVGDFNGDGRSDILWRHSNTGANAIWRSGNSTTTQAITGITTQAWKVEATDDYNGDGIDDILWRNHSSGANVIWRSANYSVPQSVAGLVNQAWVIAN